jgi:hypothetical protein
VHAMQQLCLQVLAASTCKTSAYTVSIYSSRCSGQQVVS